MNVRMPFCYGGGITTVEQAVKIINLGVEKVALSYSALNNISLMSRNWRYYRKSECCCCARC